MSPGSARMVVLAWCGRVRAVVADWAARFACCPQWTCNMPRSSSFLLPLLDQIALSLLVSFRWIPQATCTSNFVSCGLVNESLGVIGLDIAAASQYWDSQGPPLESSIEVLQNMTALTFLRLPGGLHGNLEMPRSLEQLKHLYLSGQGITRSLNALNKFPRLKFLVLQATRVSGSLIALQQLLDLEVLYIKDGANHSGDLQGHLSDLQALRSLECLWLSRVPIMGTVEEISMLPSVRY